jgi:TonB family protein
MNTNWLNMLAWCVQVAIVTAFGATLPYLFRLQASRSRLWYWHVLLLACLGLPLLQPWVRPSPGRSAVTFTTAQFHVAAHHTPAGFTISWPTVALVVLIAGIALRLLWLAVGLLRLRHYRASATALEPGDDHFADLRRWIAPEAEVLMSRHVTSPVTFGVWNAVVLLPARFRDLGLEERRSVVCHELIHVQRRDWGVAIAEELIRSILWFHPAVWWILGRIQLTREQVVDEAVIEHTGDRNRYLDALLAIASLRLSADLAPAPLFLKKRHLRQRVESIVSGVTMTKRNKLFPLAAALATLPIVIGIAAWQFPLHAAPQEAADDPGVEIQLGAAKILHRTGIAFPDEARAKQLSGTVVANVTVDDKGEVTGAQAVSGPNELRKAVVQSILNWHFDLNSSDAPHSFEIAATFNGGQAPPPNHASDSKLVPTSAGDEPRTIESINLSTLPAALQDKVSQAGMLHVGDVITHDSFKTIEPALRNIDDHLRWTGAIHDGKVAVMVSLATPQSEPKIPVRRGNFATAGVAGSVPSSAPTPARPLAPPASDASASAVSAVTPQSIQVGGNAEAANLIYQVRPVYPPLAKQARIQGTVKFNALIGADGFVKNLQAVSGHPMLVQAALEAVKDWVYKPTLLNGNPVDVTTVIDVNFTLSQ